MESQYINGMTPLIWAALHGDTAEVNRLLEVGANVKAKDNWGRTALIVAAYNGHTEIVRNLLSKGADPNARNNFCNTPVIEAALRGHADIIELLVAAGGDVNQKNKGGSSAMSIGLAQRATWVQPFLTKPKQKRLKRSQLG